ncbi:hypothetical protein DPMN_089038 [Dreissena polymorpha]|uniref:Uncharacterized protein n=1 Tax=Dreissena polymorpha TaxID=45954 RepID=A0A9D4QYF7_DREPO|nr:hypothetical protein DPMN_089038 [Dreissena polymorpha]
MGITSSKTKQKKSEESEDESAVKYEKLDNSDSSCENLKLEDVENGDDEDPFAGSSTVKQNAPISVCDAVYTGHDTIEEEKSLNFACSKSLSLTTNVLPKSPCSEVNDKDQIEAANQAKGAKVSLKKKRASHLLKRKEGDLPALSSGKLGNKVKIRKELEEQGLLTDSYGTDIFGELRGVGIIKESKANHDISDSGLAGEIKRRFPPRLAHLPIDHVTLQERLRNLTIGDAHAASGKNHASLKTVEHSDKHLDHKECEVNTVRDEEALSNDSAEVTSSDVKQRSQEVSDKSELVMKIINIETI